ncbi:N-acetylglucosamine-6-phosphate deacetylase [Bifidobacterium pseudolongum subsp. globosum]|uniref:N-acetylglucosamine-6-phosphate deacetylase n=1 Tax=Bifidobacterium pseudolongum subsp. globosum TaxID=1690 RepID=A0A2N3QGT8_9BIFI|nr:N-acetylglucosamine-6-phosphate deacetylase [Bifidobacterium pseudolongum]PKU90424.1 N-acetylglucosamine-6-phosphate deacetylase [Bifidobacterium pseudolongum subsp. globosum]
MQYKQPSEPDGLPRSTQARQAEAERIARSFEQPPQAMGIVNATRIDARGITPDSWAISECGVISETGTTAEAFEEASKRHGVAEQNHFDAHGMLLTPGYVDIHAHGAWGRSFDDGANGIRTARAGHMLHGTTRQVCSLITNPLNVMEANLRNVREAMRTRPDILGAHLEGPFISPLHKGAHDPACLCEPAPERVAALIEAADGCLRQITIAPELPHAMRAIDMFAHAGVVCAVGHTDADFETTERAFDAGARLMTHLFNAMPGLRHRAPGPIPAAVEDRRVAIELINDGFHVHNPVLRMALGFAPHRTVFVTDAMAATDCPDGGYRLGELDVRVTDGHARLVSNGAIAGSTLLLKHAVQRAVLDLGMAPQNAIEAATLTPARVFGFDRPNSVTGAPLGLVCRGYAADMLLLDPASWQVQHVWCAGRRQR